METAYSLLSPVTLVLWLLAIPACFLKGRTGFGWFGIVMFATGAVLNVTGWRYWRDGALEDWWWWLYIAQGLVVLAVVTTAALRKAEPNSWWSRHRS